MRSGPKTSRKPLYIGIGIVVVVLAAAVGWTSLKGASPEIDPARLATVERGTMVRSVVATGKVEPISKVEIKSKANGIIKRCTSTSTASSTKGTCWSSSTKSN